MLQASDTCNCKHQSKKKKENYSCLPGAAKTFSSLLLSGLIAFFPKCPICWGIYMSTFSTIGLSHLPYLNWLIPVLIFFLFIHIVFCAWRIRQNGVLPFLLSLCGGFLIIVQQKHSLGGDGMSLAGMICLLLGSFMINFNIKISPFKNLFYGK